MMYARNGYSIVQAPAQQGWSQSHPCFWWVRVTHPTPARRLAGCSLADDIYAGPEEGEGTDELFQIYEKEYKDGEEDPEES